MVYKYFRKEGSCREKESKRTHSKISYVIVNSFSVFENITRFGVGREEDAYVLYLEFRLAVYGLCEMMQKLRLDDKFIIHKG